MEEEGKPIHGGERAARNVYSAWRTLRVSETSGAGISRTQALGAIHASTGRHLHRGIDLRSYDSESTLGPANSGAGVPGVAGVDRFGVSAPVVAASITAPRGLSSQLSPIFFGFFLANVVEWK
jgi:hypothetical protein